MVSFQCEGCGDVLTKKKLDGHRSQCYNASFSCLDCMTHFRGSDYKSHKSCITEDQKYQGALYKEKPKKSVKIAPTNDHMPRTAYVEDAPDQDAGNAISIVSAPPEAPDPPPPAPHPPAVNVFDFLVTEDTPTASRVSLAAENEKSLDYTPSVPASEVSRKPKTLRHDPEYDMNGFSYGNDPIPSTRGKERPRVEYITPGTKDLRRKLEKSYGKSSSVDKKRKRHLEDLDLTAARASSHDSDAIMDDAPAPLLHSGLTGGLTRLLSKSRSPDHIDDPPSPVKRSKSASTSQSHVLKDRVSERERSKSRHTSSTGAGPLVKIRTRRTSDESRPTKKKKHRTHSAEDGSSSHHRRKHRTQKAIEYPSTTEHDSQQMVVYKSRAEFFLSLITKREEGERGMSVHKILKRYHKERRLEKEEEERELFRGLRVRKNERGEVVIFF